MLGRNLINRNRSLSPFASPLAPLTPVASLSSLDPFFSLRDDILDAFDNLSIGMTPSLDNQFVPLIQIQDKGTSYVVSAEVPGMSEKDINVSMRDNNLILEGEKRDEHKEEREGYFRSEFSYGSFYRAIPLGDDINPDKVTANYRNGVLSVSVEKRPEAQQKTKKIPIAMEKSGEKKIETKH